MCLLCPPVAGCMVKPLCWMQLLQKVQVAAGSVHGWAESLSRLIPHQACHLHAAKQDTLKM